MRPDGKRVKWSAEHRIPPFLGWPVNKWLSSKGSVKLSINRSPKWQGKQRVLWGICPFKGSRGVIMGTRGLFAFILAWEGDQRLDLVLCMEGSFGKTKLSITRTTYHKVIVEEFNFNLNVQDKLQRDEGILAWGLPTAYHFRTSSFRISFVSDNYIPKFLMAHMERNKNSKWF